MTHSPPNLHTHLANHSSAELTLPTAWIGWLLQEAQRRGQQVQAVLREPDGSWQLCSTDMVRTTEAQEFQWRVTQRHGCRGHHTRIEALRAGVVEGALLEDRPPGCAEQPARRVLVLEALLLAARGDSPA